jgi:GTP 3',8-cyclase
MPEEGGEFSPFPRLLTFPQIHQVVRAAVPLGIRKVRLTGGEPLLRPRLHQLVKLLAAEDAIEDLALTTNGVLLGRQAKDLWDSGLRRLNIHLDTLDRERFRQIARRDDLPRVLEGIQIAQGLGFSIKLNAVALKGVTDEDLLPLVEFAREQRISVRFIEFMPLDAQNLWSLDKVLTADEMIARIEAQFGRLLPVPNADPRAPATEYQMEDGTRVGFIASVSRPFCGDCNRLRLTADGKLRNCLFAREETDIGRLLEQDDLAGLQTALRDAVWQKWAGHEISRQNFKPPQRPMYSIGG